MSSLDQRLIARVTELRTEIQHVAAAGPPITEIVAAALLELEAAVAAFRARPFGLVPPIGMPGARILEEQCFDMVNALLLGFAGHFMPKPTRELIEQSARKRAEASTSLRLSEAEKVERLRTLKQELVRTEALLELDRRRIEAADNTTLPRNGFDPAIWLLQSSELERVGA